MARTRDGALPDGIPPELEAVLKESDGILGEYGAGLIWSLERIVADNITFRTTGDFATLYMPFDPMLFFADAGNGDQFALLLPPVDRPDVFVWNHEDDSRTWGAANVEFFLRWLASGVLET